MGERRDLPVWEREIREEECEMEFRIWEFRIDERRFRYDVQIDRNISITHTFQLVHGKKFVDGSHFVDNLIKH